MAGAVMDLLPRDAELARRAAGGDGAAFVRLYDKYSSEVFATSLAATGSADEAADATQTAFLRILRWPPALGAPDGDVEELLYALAFGGHSHSHRSAPQEVDHRVARLAGVGWLRSETVSKAGARFDADWSVHLWEPPEDAATPAPDPEPRPSPAGSPKRAPWRLPRLRLRLPSPAAAAAVMFLFVSAASGTLLIGGGNSDPIDAAPASARGEGVHESSQLAPREERAELRRIDKRRRSARAGEASLLRDKTLEPLLAP